MKFKFKKKNPEKKPGATVLKHCENEDIMTLCRKHLQFINVMLANRLSTIVAERVSGSVTYAKKKIKPFEAQDLRITRHATHAGHEYVTIAVNRNLSNCGKDRTQ